MGVVDSLRMRVLSWLMPDERYDVGKQNMLSRYERLRNYTRGEQKKPMLRKVGQPDDNLVINLTGLVVSRSVSLLMGRDVQFELAGESDAPEHKYLDAVWSANKRNMLLHDLAELGSIYGTCFLKMQLAEGALPRLIPLNPFYMNILTDPEDMAKILRYEARYMLKDPKGDDLARREITELGDNGWEVVEYQSGRDTGGRWAETDRYSWAYPFPPILHWKNLPDAESVYGRSDIDEDVIAIQDAVNFVASNINRILRYHAHPKTWGRGFTGSTETVSWGADDLVKIPSETGMIGNLEMQSDLASSTRFMEVLRQTLFDLSRTVDISSMADKLGALTNFGLRVLFYDSLNKLETKRNLYGDALIEMNRRLLAVGGFEGVNPGDVTWPDALPVNELDQAQIVQTDLNSGIVSKQTAATKRGYDWTNEEERINSAKASGDNVGAALLRAFNQGQQ